MRKLKIAVLSFITSFMLMFGIALTPVVAAPSVPATVPVSQAASLMVPTGNDWAGAKVTNSWWSNRGLLICKDGSTNALGNRICVNGWGYLYRGENSYKKYWWRDIDYIWVDSGCVLYSSSPFFAVNRVYRSTGAWARVYNYHDMTATYTCRG